ncbi:hypothetical protein BJX64DRAFT_264354 [Aspergillus heterothallicus]
MDWDRNRRFDDHRGGESYRPGTSRAYGRRSRSPPRIRSPPSRLVADTWVPSTARAYNRARSRSPVFRRRTSRSPPAYKRDSAQGSYSKPYTPRKFSPRRDIRPRSPLQIPRRPRSPYGEDRARDAGWSQSALNSRPPRDTSPPSRDSGYYRNDRRLASGCRYPRSGSPSRHGPASENDQRQPAMSRARSPYYGGRKESASERFSGYRRRSQSPNDSLSKRPISHESMPSSRRSSPFHNKATSAGLRANRSRSPPAIYFDRCRSIDRGVPSNLSDRTSIGREAKVSGSETRPKSPFAAEACAMPILDRDDAASPRAAGIIGSANNIKPLYPSNIPSQPKAFAHTSYRSSSTSLPHGPKSLSAHSRASNISILSAPTRPRGNPGFKENGWTGSLSRRGPTPVSTHGVPTAPRSTQSTASSVESPRARSYRSESVSGASTSAQRLSKHFVGLSTIIPGGRPFASELEVIIERRLSQLDADKDRLFDQNTETQKLKRMGLSDWDRLARESSICALKSELAESHLQCIADTQGNIDRAVF